MFVDLRIEAVRVVPFARGRVRGEGFTQCGVWKLQWRVGGRLRRWLWMWVYWPGRWVRGCWLLGGGCGLTFEEGEAVLAVIVLWQCCFAEPSDD